MSFRDDIANGRAHGVDAELALSVPTIPGVFAGVLEMVAMESDPIRRSVGTYQTKDGRNHSVGRVTTPQTMNITVYIAERESVIGLESWYEAAGPGGLELAKVNVTATKLTAEGSPISVRELERCWPTNIEESGTGSNGAATYKVTLSYDRAYPIPT